MKTKRQTLNARDYVDRPSEIWKAIPQDVKFEIDFALHKGEKEEAINRFMCAIEGFDLLTAQRLVEQRGTELKKTV